MSFILQFMLRNTILALELKILNYPKSVIFNKYWDLNKFIEF